MNIHQALEQMEVFLRDFSPILYNYKLQLMKAGFTEKEAMRLVVNYQESTIRGEKKS